MKVKSESEVAQSCPTLSDRMDCSLPGSSHGNSIFSFFEESPYFDSFFFLLIVALTRSSVLAWKIPGMVEPDGLLSMGSHRVRHD